MDKHLINPDEWGFAESSIQVNILSNSNLTTITSIYFRNWIGLTFGDIKMLMKQQIPNLKTIKHEYINILNSNNKIFKDSEIISNVLRKQYSEDLFDEKYLTTVTLECIINDFKNIEKIIYSENDLKFLHQFEEKNKGDKRDNINIIIRKLNGEKILFPINKNETLGNLKHYLCITIVGVCPTQILLCYKGCPCNYAHTIEEENIKDGDNILLILQISGS